MAGSNINRVIITGNLTRDPETRAAGGTTVTSLRIACNGRRRNQETQSWEDVPNYFDVSVWGAQGENCQKFLSKGRSVAIDGSLRWREWADKTTGDKRQGVDIVADTVQFLGGGGEGGSNGGSGGGYSASGYSNGGSNRPASDVSIDTKDFDVSPVGAGADDDIPF